MIATLFVKNAKPSQVDLPKKVETTTDTDVKDNPYDLQLKFPYRLADEMEELKTRNPALLDVIEFCRHYAAFNFNKPVMVTMIYRTDAEQDDLYKNDAKYKLKKFKSPHQFYHAFDLRSRTFTRAEIDLMVTALNNQFNAFNLYKFTALCHDIDGDGPQAEHFHVQYCKKG